MSYDVYGPYIVVVMLITFLALFAWVLHPKNKAGFDDAANLPFEDDDEDNNAKADNGRIEK
ncbi:cbb3-type cytochrome c oxidase subunit 3 [Pontibacterium sp. N1Y112]|uniref:Cbb3-type cytochrome c oxidase subunit 3 n=1 Tax=Pontibacterium sinense TaxID=2781979 RepID=A0A8J7FXW0_9GAMM|nr:cbb3-type cytochrome c oxidase subunit 3 [Pontibacterium sinense]